MPDLGGKNVNPDIAEQSLSKLDDLAEKSAEKIRGSAAHYVTANQALRDDLGLCDRSSRKTNSWIKCLVNAYLRVF